MINVLLVTSPHVRHPAVLQNDFSIDPSVMYSFAPVGLLALAAVARQRLSITPIVYDLNRRIIDGTIVLGADFYRNAAREICALDPDVVGFMTECDSYHHVLQICQCIKELRPDCQVILGGPHASAVARPTMERYPCIDTICIGESELSFPDFLADVRDGNIRALPGGLRRSKTGELIDGGPRQLVGDLDSLPIPAYDLYHPDPDEEVFLEVGRGCPFKCTFCSTAPYWQRRHRVKSPQRILQEIQHVVRLFGVRRVHFTHDLFTTDRSWVKTVCDVLIGAEVPVLWTCSARTDTVDEELLALMARAGCNAIYFGIESGSKRILKEIHKDIPIDHSIETLRTCQRLGITPNAGFIIGFPTEDEHSMSDTFFAFGRALETGCRPTHIFGFCPFADSSIYKTLEDMECTGHFLDLPLGRETDEANRKLIASGPELFGSYFRPKLSHLPGYEKGIISAVDEFSPLVDAVRLPCMILAKAVGGMQAVYRDWVSWIAQLGLERGNAAHRRYYGSPGDFCDFIIERLQSNSAAPPYALSLARALRTSLALTATWKEVAATTMANHRTLPFSIAVEEVRPSTSLALGDVVATLEVDYDVSAALSDLRWDESYNPERGPAFLIWQMAREGELRLTKVDAFLFRVINDLKSRPQTAAALIASWTDVPYVPHGTSADSSDALSSLTEAVRAGLVAIMG